MKYILLTIILSVILFIPTHHSFADITTGLIGHWTFDEGSGTTAGDSSGNGNNGTLTNNPTWTTGQIGGAMNFDGSDDYVTMGDITTVELLTQASFSAWFKKTGDGDATNMLISKNDSYEIKVRESSVNQYDFAIDNVDAGFTGAPTDNVWTHVVMVYDAGVTNGTKLYENGVLIDSATLSRGTISDRTTALTIGGREGSYNFAGLIDDVRIYNRSLSQADITELYNAGSGTPPPTCISFTYSAWSPSTCPVSETQTRTVTSSLPSGCTGGTPDTTQSCTYIPTSDTEAPSTPTNLTATAISSSQINLSWTASTDDTAVTGYKIYRNGSQITTVTGTSYSNTGLTAETAYIYTVSAYDAAGNTSGQSVEASTTTQAGDPPPDPSWPGNPFYSKDTQYSTSGTWQFPTIRSSHPRIFFGRTC